MKLILRAPILAALVGLGGAMGTHAAADVNYTGNWWNPDQNGMGMPCVQQDQTIFCTWFLYDGAGRGTFLFSSGVLQKDAQGRNYYAADLQRASGTPPVGFDPTHTIVAPAGTMSLTFTGADSATFTFQFDGGSGTLLLTTFQFGCAPPSKWDLASMACVVPNSNPTMPGPTPCDPASMYCYGGGY